MLLGELRNILRNELEENGDSKLPFGIGEPMSWRGSYDEVAFPVVPNTVQESLNNVDKALSEEFTGWKGGAFVYGSSTPVNFEPSESTYSDGEYVLDMISELDYEFDAAYPNGLQDEEAYLVHLMIEEKIQ